MSKSARKDRIPLIEASDSTDIYRRVRSEFEFAKKVSAKVAGINKTDPATFDLEGCMEERRVRAVGNFIKENKHRGLTDDWIGLSVVFNGYSLLENNLHILLAAAIWILDRISETEIDFKEVYKLLPTDEDEVFDSLDTPELWDSQYDFALILSVEYVLHFRNRDIAPLERDGDGGDRVFTSMLLAQGKTHADVPSRQRFEKLLSLIPQDKIDAAVEHFKAYFWKWTDRTVKGQALLEEKCSKTRKEVNDIRVRINKMRDELDEMVAQFEKERKNTRKAIKSPLMPGIGKLSESMIPQGAPYSTATNGFISDPNQTKFNMALTALRKIEDENIELSKLYDEQCQKKRVFNSYISGFGALSEEDSKELYGQVIPELVAPLPIPDPFEMCFALLYLSDRDDDIPWLYGACHGAMVAATEYLPWACCDYEERHDKYWNGESNCSDNSSEMPDWYQKILENKASDVILSRMQYVYGTGKSKEEIKENRSSLLRSDVQYSILGIKIADSASVMKHRPLFFVIQLCLSTGFLPFYVVFGFYRASTSFHTADYLPSFYQNSSFRLFFYNVLNVRYLGFLPLKSPVESIFLWYSV